MNNRHIPYWVKNKMMKLRSSEIENNESEEVGYLNVNVLRYMQKTPIADAFVRVSKLTISGLYGEKGSGVYIDTNKSDNNGMVPTFILPVLEDENEIYILTIQAPGYHNAYVFDVPIYPEITTTYDIYLRYYTLSDEPDFEFILQPQIQNTNESRGLWFE